MAINRYTELAQAFDAIAATYDNDFGPEYSQIMGWFREENLELLQTTFPPQADLLEIGCGTGEEALHLAKQGYRITAIDVSPRMTAITRQKAKAAGLAERITALTLPAGKLRELDFLYKFDGAYASFGSLNCEPDLTGLAGALAGLLIPEGVFICSVMARLSPFEIGWYMSHLQPRTALRRLKPGWQRVSVMAANDDQSPLKVPTRYLSRRDLILAFKPHMVLKRSRAVGLLVPPPYLEAIYRRLPTFWRRMALLERRLRHHWPWRDMGDHISLVFRVR